jgi:hypothetical protein
MIITNTEGLPQPLVDAVTKDPYDSGGSDLTVTQVISPARQIALRKQYANEITEDASDRLWALMGQIGHGVLERAASAGIVEKRWFGTMDGWIISGRCDLLLASMTLLDYKFCSVWAAKDGVKPEWEQQLNLLAWLAGAHGLTVADAQIVCIFRDWSVMEARRDASYPQKQVKVMPVSLWGFEKQQEFCRQRVAAHSAAQGGQLPECTSEERWEKLPKWAVMRKGRKRAVRLYDTEAEAIKHVASEKAGHSVEARPGESIRCQAYCNAAPFCLQAKALGIGAPLEPEEAELPVSEIPEDPIPEMPEVR